MFDPIWNWLSTHCPVIIVILLAVSITWYISSVIFHWTHRIKNTEKECAKIDAHITPQLITINNSLNTLNGSFNSLVVHLQAKDGTGTFPTQIFISKSPIRLTELGLEILSSIGGKSFVDNNIDLLINKMNTAGIKTALDSQTMAPIIINEISSADSFNDIKNYIYRNPFYKTTIDQKEVSVPLDMGMVSNIMGIYLRDKYLEKHTHLNPADIPS